jgi:hypothetical protein
VTVRLYHEFNNESMHPLQINGNLSAMPSGWDANTLSCQIDPASIPCRFFSEPNFRGQCLTLIQGGGCDDLDRLQGRWRNKIRSVAMGAGFDAEVEGDEDVLSNPRIEEALNDASLAHLFVPGQPNPSVAEAGCIWRDGKRTAFMRYGPPNAPIGAHLRIIVLKPTYPQFCNGGRSAQNEDLSMILESWTYDPMAPFAQLTLTGRPST